MSRLKAGSDTITVKPASNIYTILSAVACVVVILGIIAVWTRGNDLFDGLWSKNTPAPTSIRR